MILALQEGGDEIDDGRTLQRQPPASAFWNMQSAFHAEVAQAIDSEHTQFPRLPNWKLLLKKSFC